MAQLRKGTTYATGDQVTAANLNALVDSAILLNGAITEQTAGTASGTDNILVAGASDLRKVTVSSLLSGTVKTDGSSTMTGELTLSGPPTVSLSAASKGYVDTKVAAASSNVSDTSLLKIDGSRAMAGALTLSGNATAALHAVPKQQLESYANGTFLFSTNGYQKLPSGLIIQWGTTDLIGGDSSASVTFPTPFQNQVFSITVTPKGGIYGGNSGVYSAGNITNTGFTMYNGQDYVVNIMWIAIGY